MKKIYLFLLIVPILFINCKKLEQVPESTASKSAVFGSEKGLELFTNSFYNMLPSANNIHTADMMSDYGARRDAPVFLRDGGYSPTVNDNTSASAYNLVALGSDWDWGWGSLRNLNYFIENNVNQSIPLETRQHYTGLARFFRTWFYFEKIKRYGDVPWYSQPLDVTNPDLYKERDPRTLVMDSLLADINFAIQNIQTISDGSRSLITKNIALAFKARICLFEGTFRKYHSNLGLNSTSDFWLNEAVNAAQTVIVESNFKVYDGAGTDQSYRKLFTSQSPIADEIMMAAISDASLGILHAANWYGTSATTGVRFNFIRTFINTYLNIDGSPFTNDPNYKTLQFKDEVKGRDKRLQQTIRMGDYKRINGGVLVPAPPVFSYTYTGYMPIKWCLDDTYYDTRDLNNNAVSIFRFAEVLLNYAEAKAELGTLTDEDWTKTIGALRKRAGITSGTTTKPIIIDPYLKNNYFPDISDPVILEIRRERGIELCLEGFRFYDIMRWKRGELMEMKWNGMYVPELNTPIDLNGDGIQDVAFYKEMPANKVAGVTYINVAPTVNNLPNPQQLSNGSSGEVTWLNNIPRKWEDKKYYYPIPESHRITNPKLKQNKGW